MATKLGLLDRLRTLVTGVAPASAKYDVTARSWTTPFQNQPVWTQADYTAFAREGYQQNVYVYRGVRIVADAIGGLRWLVVRKKSNGEVEEVPNHPALKLIRRPNPRTGQARFMASIEAHLILQGNAYIQASGPTGGANAGKPLELWTMRPDRVKVIAGDQFEPVKGYQYIAFTEPIVMPEPQVLHLRNFHPLSDFYGLAGLEPGARSVDTNNEGRAWNKALLQNSARPPGMFSTQQPLNDTQYERLQAQLAERYEGARNAGRPMIADGAPVEWTSFGYSPAEMDWLNGLKLTAEEIALAIGCPPELMGASIRRFATYAEARKALYHETVLPEADTIRDELNNWLMPKYGDGCELDYDRDGIEAIREDRAQVWTMSDKAFAGGTITQNESRIAKGYDEVPDGDFFVMPVSSMRTDEPEDISEIDTPPGDEGGSSAAEEDPKEDAAPTKAWEHKVFRLNTPKKRAQHYKGLARRRQAWTKSIKRAALKRLRAQQADIVAAIKGASSPAMALHAAEAAVASQRHAWEKFYRATYMTVGADFRKAVYKGLKSDLLADWTLTGPRETKARNAIVAFVKSDEQATSKWNEAVAQYLDQNAGTKIDGILQTDLDRLRKQMSEGVLAEEGIDELAARIEDYLDPIYANRAATVARTEVIPASNLGSQMAAKSTDLPLDKTWLATGDDRTREDHSDADGQTVDINANYTVGGAELLFAGDTSQGAPPDETINCRCSETYDVREEEESE